jgi:putative acetyltransferase
LVVQIREETTADLEAIREVIGRAFGEEPVAPLVDRLRDDGLVVTSLVAIEDGQVIGHILFSALAIETDRGAVPAATLSPLGVIPERQRLGIGSALVHRGLAVCRERGLAAVVVVGHPIYYPRFGFSAELARAVRSRYSGAGEAWMALELTPGALAGGGEARIPSVFDLVD